ncbi:hypothetical protein [Streptacidiphilus sp. MAP5-3]|uniref:hypothetical protein n=1 Tax=unclassified Streptacidiphilus TaxID=2643834 RepID=UPI0035186F42
MTDTAARPQHGLLFHASAAAAALLALPWWHRALHIGADQYGGAWALTLAAAVLYRRRPGWFRYALLLASIAGAVTDMPVLHDSVSWLTGAAW